MVSLLPFYGLRKQGTNKMNSLAQYHPPWVAEKAETLVISYNHRTSFAARDRETHEWVIT